MKILKRFLEKFGKAFVPRRFSPLIHDYLLKTGIMKVPYVLFGSLFYVSVAITTIIFGFFIYSYLSDLPYWELFILTFMIWMLLNLAVAVIIILIIYFYLDLRIFNRTNSIEEMLPEFLQQISSNLKGGMTFENAMWNAINPRFKIIAAETTEVMKRVMTGTSTQDALRHFAKKYNSKNLKRVVNLIVSELDSGGNISELIDKMVKDLEKMRELKSEMTASVVGYMMMISAIVVFFAPMLFALSFHLMSIITGFVRNLSPKLRSPASVQIGISSAQIDTHDFKIFSVLAILSISVIASFIVSLIEKGNIKGGVKYIPLYIMGSLSSYFFFLYLITSFFKVF